MHPQLLFRSEALADFDDLGFSVGTEARLKQGLSDVLSVRETARTLVLKKGGVEVLRKALTLDPERRTTVRP